MFYRGQNKPQKEEKGITVVVYDKNKFNYFICQQNYISTIFEQPPSYYSVIDDSTFVTFYSIKDSFVSYDRFDSKFKQLLKTYLINDMGYHTTYDSLESATIYIPDYCCYKSDHVPYIWFVDEQRDTVLKGNENLYDRINELMPEYNGFGIHDIEEGKY